MHISYFRCFMVGTIIEKIYQPMINRVLFRF
jgi:hypothetical protein